MRHRLRAIEHVCLEASSRLEDHGTLLFSMPQRDVEKLGSGILPDSRLAVRAILDLGEGSSSPRTGSLVVMEIGDQKDVFVDRRVPIAKRLGGGSHVEDLLTNFVRSRQGEPISRGHLCQLGEWHGYGHLIDQERWRRLAEKSGWTPKPGTEVIIDHATYEVDIDETMDAKSRRLEQFTTSEAGICYLLERFVEAEEEPMDREYRAALTADDLFAGLDDTRDFSLDFSRLTLNPRIIHPSFPVTWVNKSQIGRTTLDRASLANESHLDSDSTLPSRLLEMAIYLPDLEEQQFILDTSTRVDLLHTEITAANTELWDGVTSAHNVSETLDAFDHYEVELWRSRTNVDFEHVELPLFDRLKFDCFYLYDSSGQTALELSTSWVHFTPSPHPEDRVNACYVVKDYQKAELFSYDQENDWPKDHEAIEGLDTFFKQLHLYDESDV